MGKISAEVNSVKQEYNALPGKAVSGSVCVHSIGNIEYMVERVFSGHRTLKQVVVEEIVSGANSFPTFDHSARPML